MSHSQCPDARPEPDGPRSCSNKPSGLRVLPGSNEKEMMTFASARGHLTRTLAGYFAQCIHTISARSSFGHAREWPRQSSGEWARLGDSASVWAGYRGLTRTTTVGEEARWLRGCAAEQEAQLDSGRQPGAPDLTKTWQAFDSSKVSELANMGR